MGLRMKETTDMVAVAITVLVLGVAVYFGASAFFELVGNLYDWLDGFIWAFFAGIVAFFVAIWLVFIMFAITVWCIIMVLTLLGGLLTLFVK